MSISSLAVQVGQRAVAPYAMILAAVFFYASLPVGLVMLAAERPLLSVALWEFWVGVGDAAGLRPASPALRSLLGGPSCWTGGPGWCASGTLHVVFFTLALGRVDPSVATVVFHLSNSLYVVILAGSSGAAGPRCSVPLASWVLVAGCFAALALAVFSECGPGAWQGMAWGWTLMLGYGLCFLTALSAGMLAFVVPWAFRVSRTVWRPPGWRLRLVS